MTINKKCPFFKTKCIKDLCTLWTHLLGKDPQTGQPVDEYACAFTWLPVLLIENAKNVAHNQAAIEDFRNKSCKFQDEFLGAINATKKLKEAEGPKKLKEIDAIDVKIEE